MPQAARLGDMTAHGGVITTGMPNVLIGGMPAARVTDMHVCPMVTGLVPHVGGPILPPAAVNVLIGGLPAARVTDMAVCVGPPDIITMGCPTVMIGTITSAQSGQNAGQVQDEQIQGQTATRGIEGSTGTSGGAGAAGGSGAGPEGPGSIAGGGEGPAGTGALGGAAQDPNEFKLGVSNEKGLLDDTAKTKYDASVKWGGDEGALTQEGPVKVGSYDWEAKSNVSFDPKAGTFEANAIKAKAEGSMVEFDFEGKSKYVDSEASVKVLSAEGKAELGASWGPEAKGIRAELGGEVALYKGEAETTFKIPLWGEHQLSIGGKAEGLVGAAAEGKAILGQTTDGFGLELSAKAGAGVGGGLGLNIKFK